MKNKKLYYEEENGVFYWVGKTPKTIKIDWVVNHNCDGSELDQNVRWKNLVAREGGKHPIKQNDEEGILIYPFQGGQPFYLEPATIEHLETEIKSCKGFGVSEQYYQDLMECL